jgi:hypothetical protein
MIGKFFVQASRNHLMPDTIDVPHFADVPGEPTIVNEAGQRGLEGKGGVPVRYLLCSVHGRAYGWRCYYKGQTKSWQHSL